VTDLIAILGPASKEILTTNDPVADQQMRRKFVERAAAKMKLVPDPNEDNAQTLLIGKDEWPLPIPIVKVNGEWPLRSKIISSPGEQDGLYWSSTDGQDESPIGAIVARAFAEGYTKKQDHPYHGYYFRILTAQGTHAAGGAMSYLHNGLMTSGFALIAWPSDYRSTGNDLPRGQDRDCLPEGSWTKNFSDRRRLYCLRPGQDMDASIDSGEKVTSGQCKGFAGPRAFLTSGVAATHSFCPCPQATSGATLILAGANSPPTTLRKVRLSRFDNKIRPRTDLSAH
jgi:Protein of unknown function (DUF2950)